MNNDFICVYPPEADKSAEICGLFNLYLKILKMSLASRRPLNRVFLVKNNIRLC